MNIAGRKIAQTIEELSFVTSVPKMFAECLTLMSWLKIKKIVKIFKNIYVLFEKKRPKPSKFFDIFRIPVVITPEPYIFRGSILFPMTDHSGRQHITISHENISFWLYVKTA